MYADRKTFDTLPICMAEGQIQEDYMKFVKTKIKNREQLMYAPDCKKLKSCMEEDRQCPVLPHCSGGVSFQRLGKRDDSSLRKGECQAKYKDTLNKCELSGPA